MGESAGAPSRRWRAYLADGLIVLLLLVLVAKLTYHIAEVRDLPLCDDGSYMCLGLVTKAQGPPPAEGGPLYTLWYFAVSRLERDPIHLYYLSWTLLVALLVVGFYLLVRLLGGTRPAALLSAALLLTSELVNTQPYVSHPATILLVFGFALALRVRPRPLAVAALACALLLASYARPEMYVAFLLLGAAGLAGGLRALWRTPGRWRVPAAAALLVLAPAVLLSRTLGVPLGGGRSFIAFQQHYAINVAENSRRSVPVHYESSTDQVAREDFGDAQTLGAALRANPRAFLWHVGMNAEHLPLAVWEAAAPDLGVKKPLNWVVSALAAAGVLLGCFGLYRRWSGRGASGGGHARFVAAALLGALLAPTAAAVLLIWPHAHYLMPVLTLLLALAASGLPHAPWCGRLWAGLESRRGLVALAAALLLLTPNQAGRCWDLQSWLHVNARHPNQPPYERRIADALRTLKFDRPVVLLAPFGHFRTFYGHLPGIEVGIEKKDCGFREFLRRTGVTVVVLDPFLAADPLYRNDPEFQDFMTGKSTDGFTCRDIPGLPARIAVRDDLLLAAVEDRSR